MIMIHISGNHRFISREKFAKIIVVLHLTLTVLAPMVHFFNGCFPTNPNEFWDTDGDGIGDNSDNDIDGDEDIEFS